jgi:hypothetical protein
MPGQRRGNFRSRLTALEQRAREEGDRDGRRVVVWLPRKDGDAGPVGVRSRTAGVLTVVYEHGQPDPPLPEGW